MRFSVIVPFKNEEIYLGACVEALRHQTWPRQDYELIFVDNGSADRSCEIVSKYPDIRILHEEKPGAYAARNQGIKVAQGDVIAFTDADCRVSIDWLYQISKKLEEGETQIMLGKRGLVSGVSRWLRVFECYENAKADYVYRHEYRRYYFGYTNNMAVKRELFETVGFFREWRRAADSEFIHRCVSRSPALKIVYCDKMIVTHLEIKKVKQWLDKMSLYGEYNEQMSGLSDYRKLSLRDNLLILKHCENEIRRLFSNRIPVLFLMILSFLAYRWGMAKGWAKSWIKIA